MACSVAISGPDPRGLHKEPWQSVIVVPNAVLEGFGSPGHLGTFEGRSQSLLVEIEKCGVWRGFDGS